MLVESVRHYLLRLPARKARLKVRQLGDSRPDRLVGGAHGAEDAEQLVNLTVSGKKDSLV